MLDSKNAPIAPLGRADFLDGDGRALVHADFLLAARRNQSACADHCKYARWYAAAEAVLGTSVAAAHRVPKSITPTTLHVASVRALLASLDAREGGLSRALGPDGATEFTLYNAFVRGAGAVEPFECAHALSDVPTDEVAATVFTHSGLVGASTTASRRCAVSPPPRRRRTRASLASTVASPTSRRCARAAPSSSSCSASSAAGAASSATATTSDSAGSASRRGSVVSRALETTIGTLTAT